jgi:hypothetical protein
MRRLGQHTISFPYVGRFRAAGLTEDAVARINAGLSRPNYQTALNLRPPLLAYELLGFSQCSMAGPRFILNFEHSNEFNALDVLTF